MRIRYPLEYESIVRGHARNYRLDPALLAAVIYQESKFRPTVKSKSGAIGLMQLLPDTAKGIAIHTGGTQFRVHDLYNPELNVRYGSWYLRHLLDRYGDEVLAVDGRDIAAWDLPALSGLLDDGEPGRKVPVRVRRGEQEKLLRIRLAEVIR